MYNRLTCTKKFVEELKDFGAVHGGLRGARAGDRQQYLKQVVLSTVEELIQGLSTSWLVKQSLHPGETLLEQLLVHSVTTQ